MEKIVFLDRQTIKVPLRKPAFAHEWVDYPWTSPEDVARHIQGATILVTNKVKLFEKDLQTNSHIKLIAVSATGVDNIDLAYCKKAGVRVANVPHYSRESLPEHVFMLMLALKKNLIRYREDIQKGVWSASKSPALTEYPIQDLRGSTLGIVGYGELGRGVEQLAKAFGMRVLISERKGTSVVRPGRVAFEGVLTQSDVISLHCPLSAETKNLIGAAELSRMKPSAILINTARGPLVDAEALVAALTAGKLAGAGLDVLHVEPPPADHPLLKLKLPNLILTPHNAWASDHSLANLAEALIQNIEAYVAGTPKNLV
jgi:glycerate dehydrogenase